MSGKELPPPGGGQDIEAMLRRRRVSSGEQAEAPAPAAAPAAKKAAGMERRSWYMTKAAGEALAAVLEDLHYSTRQPKHVVLGEVVAVALEHQAEIERRLKGRK